MPEFAAVLGIEEQEPLAHLTGRIAHNRVCVGVVSRRPVENLHSKRPLLEQIRFAYQSVLDDVFEQRRIALAVGEMRAGQNRLQLAENGIAFLLGLRMPSVDRYVSSVHSYPIHRIILACFAACKDV